MLNIHNRRHDQIICMTLFENAIITAPLAAHEADRNET
jgi:hypothetical protein